MAADKLCPRCDYDLQGGIDAWTTECPLEGTCPECGLRFAWTTIIKPLPTPPWSVEHCSGSRPQILYAAFSSAWWAFTPRFLWRQLLLSMPVRPSRLVLMLAIWFLVMYASLVACMVLFVYAECYLVLQTNGTSGPNFWTDYSATVTHRLKGDPATWVFPFCHIDAINALFGKTGVGRRSVLPAAALLSGSLAVILPATLALLPFSLRRAKVQRRHLVRLTAYWLAWGPLLAFMPALAQSLYFQIYLALDFMASSRMQKAIRTPQTSTETILLSIMNNSALLVILLMPIPMWWFWRNACKHYLRIPRPGIVAAAQILIGMMLAAVMGLFSSPGLDLFMHLATSLFDRK